MRIPTQKTYIFLYSDNCALSVLFETCGPLMRIRMSFSDEGTRYARTLLLPTKRVKDQRDPSAGFSVISGRFALTLESMPKTIRVYGHMTGFTAGKDLLFDAEGIWKQSVRGEVYISAFSVKGSCVLGEQQYYFASAHSGALVCRGTEASRINLLTADIACAMPFIMYMTEKNYYFRRGGEAMYMQSALPSLSRTGLCSAASAPQKGFLLPVVLSGELSVSENERITVSHLHAFARQEK